MARVPKVLVANWRLKLSALGLSVFLWALVQTEPLSQETFPSVPVRVEIADTAWTLAGAPSPASVEMRLAGPAREIIRVVREGTSLRVPIGTVGSRDTLVALQRDWVEFGQGAGITVESFSPATLRLSFEPAVTTTLPLSLRVQGQLPPELALVTPLALNPESVQVRGPESRLAGLDSIPLVPFDLGEVTESDVLTIPADTTGLAEASVLPTGAAVTVRVEPRMERIIDGVAVQADVPRGGSAVTVDPSSVRVHVSGARSLVTALDLTSLRVSLAPESLSGLLPGEERRVRLRVEGLPELVSGRASVEVVSVRLASSPPGPDTP